MMRGVLEIAELHIINISVEISSKPQGLLILNDPITLMKVFSISMDDIHLAVWKFVVSANPISLLKSMHCLLKNLLNFFVC